MSTLNYWLVARGVTKDIRTTLKYSGNTIAFDEIVNFLGSKELKLKKEDKYSSGEGLYIWGRSTTKGGGEIIKGKSKSRSKSRARDKKCYYCNKEGHFIKDCYNKKKDDKGKTKVDGYAIVVATSESDSGVALAMPLSQSSQEWILDFECTFHMCPRRD